MWLQNGGYLGRYNSGVHTPVQVQQTYFFVFQADPNVPYKGGGGGFRALARSATHEEVVHYANQLVKGKLNATTLLTLTANASTTTLSHPNLGATSVLLFMPTTADAAAEIGAGTLFVSTATQQKGSAIVTHANNSQIDRIFKVLIIG